MISQLPGAPAVAGDATAKSSTCKLFQQTPQNMWIQTKTGDPMQRPRNSTQNDNQNSTQNSRGSKNL